MHFPGTWIRPILIGENILPTYLDKFIHRFLLVLGGLFAVRCHECWIPTFEKMHLTVLLEDGWILTYLALRRIRVPLDLTCKDQNSDFQ